jgi:chorismate mutase/prephenate dehydratase
MMSEELKKFRAQIDAIDDELLKLVNLRAKLAQDIGHAKKGSVVLRPEREAQVLQRLVAANTGPLPPQSITALFTEIMSHCRALEEPLSVAYLGPEGTFSEEAARRRFGSAISGSPCNSFDEVFREVESGRSKYGMVPVENSSEGAIGHILDLLVGSLLKVCGEVDLPVHQCLLSRTGFENIRTVYSHPQSLGQCHEWLNANLPKAMRNPVSSNAEAARLAAEHPQDSAAVAGKLAGERFAVPILAVNIEDDPRNTTRFLVLGNQEVAASGKDKTSLVMSAANRPGAVHDLLVPFANHGVSMSKLESRPAKSGLWEYVFFVDIEGHQTDKKVAAALAELKSVAAFVKILGSYPVASV